MYKRYLVAVLVIGFVFGCAPKPQQQYSQWIFDKAWYEKNNSGTVQFKALNGRTYSVRGEYLWNYYQVSTKLINLTQISTALVITNIDGLNAFAYKQNGINRIGITIDMLNKFGNDPDALASIIGHELAHLKLDHQSERASRKQTTDRASAVVGGVLGAFIPFGGTLTNISATAISNTYTRDEERDADKQGMLWAIAAGYSPCGFVRLNKEIQKNDTSSTISFLRTHPMSSERLQTASDLALKNNFGRCE